jgi:biopolymer transport protein ExbD
MIFRVKTRTPISFEPIALADIVINLFVFFLLSFGLFASFDALKSGAIPIQLPKGGENLDNSDKKPLAIVINQSGALFVARHVTSKENLKEKVNHELEMRKNKDVILRADQHLRLEQLVGALDILRQTSARAIAIETQPRETATP